MAIKHEGGGGKALMAWPLRKEPSFFMASLSNSALFFICKNVCSYIPRTFKFNCFQRVCGHYRNIIIRTKW